jgi:hypothetical protein
MRALIAAIAILAAVPGAASAMTLMTEDSRVFDDMRGSPLSEYGYTVAEQMGAEMMRYHRGLEGGRRDGAHAPPDVGLYHRRVNGWVDDVVRRGFRPYLAITYQPDSYVRMPSAKRFGRWCGEIATAYGDRISDFAVWNEPNNDLWGPLLMGDPARYNRLYRSCYAAIKAGTGGAARVLYGEIDAHAHDPCAWVENSLDDGGTTLADGLAIHTYQWRTPPDRPDGTWCQGIGRLDDWNAAKRSWARRGLLRTPEGGEPPLLVTEHGYCAPHGECPATRHGSANAIASEAERARLIRDAFLFAQSRGVEVFSLYHLFNQPEGDPLWDSGILDADTGVATPSVCALRDLTALRLVSLDRDIGRWDPGPIGCR